MRASLEGRGEDASVSVPQTRNPCIWLSRRAVRPGPGPAQPTYRGSPYALGVARADLDKQPTDVRRMFDAVAQRYDVTNDVLSLGQDRRWRGEVIRAVAPLPGERVLDLAAGTGTSSQPFADAGAEVVPVRLLARHAPGRQGAPAAPAVHGRRRHPAALRRRHLRRRHDLVRAAQHRRPRGRAPRDAARHPARRTPRGLRVQPPHVGAVPHRVRRVPDEGAPAASPAPSAPAPTPTSTSPSRSGPGPTRPRWPSLVAAAGWQRPEWRNLSGGIVTLHRATA